MTALVRTVSSKLEAGMIVHFYGARFELQDDRKVSIRMGSEYGPERPTYGITGKWLDGDYVPFYFGPEKDWRFQGNDLATWAVEGSQVEADLAKGEWVAED